MTSMPSGAFFEPQLERRSYLFRSMALRTLRGLQCATAVVCDSGWTRSELLRHELLPLDRLKVVRLPSAPEFRPSSDAVADRIAEELLGEVLGRQILLHVGSTMPRKRIDVLLKVFAGVHSSFPDSRLVRVGAPFNQEQTDLIKKLSIENAILQLPEVARDVLAAIYRKARLLLLPSEREGFGLPLVEALACGTPVLASDIGVLREIGGDAAEYCAVGDVEQWIHRTQSILICTDNDSIAVRAWRQKGIERASHLDCSSYAKKIMSVYSALLS